MFERESSVKKDKWFVLSDSTTVVSGSEIRCSLLNFSNGKYRMSLGFFVCM